MEILLYDYVDEYDYLYTIGSGDLSASVVVPKIKAATGQPLTIRIASVGGSGLDAILIYNAIVEHGDVTTINQGFALSAAALIAMAGKNRKTYSSSLFMIHNASIDMWLMGRLNAEQIEREAAGLKAFDKVQVELLTKYTGVSEIDAKEMLSAETWLTGKEATDKGFFTELIELGETEPMQAIAYKRMVAMTNGKFVATAKDKLKIKENNMSVIEELKAQHEENKGFFAEIKNMLGFKPKAEGEKPEEEVPVQEEVPAEVAEDDIEAIKAENAQLKAEKAEAQASLAEAKTMMAETKTLLSEVKSNYKPAAEERAFRPADKATDDKPERFKTVK